MRACVYFGSKAASYLHVHVGFIVHVGDHDAIWWLRWSCGGSGGHHVMMWWIRWASCDHVVDLVGIM